MNKLNDSFKKNHQKNSMKPLQENHFVQNPGIALVLSHQIKVFLWIFVLLLTVTTNKRSDFITVAASLFYCTYIGLNEQMNRN